METVSHHFDVAMEDLEARYEFIEGLVCALLLHQIDQPAGGSTNEVNEVQGTFVEKEIKKLDGLDGLGGSKKVGQDGETETEEEVKEGKSNKKI